jgi:hypothetical protein
MSGAIGVFGDLPAEFGELPLRGAPREVGVGLREAQLGQPVQPRRPGERLGQEQHVGVGVLDLADQPGPEVRWFGVRIVDAKYLDAVGYPEQHDAQHLVVEARRIVVEIQRIDVLVFLRRILGVGDGAIGQHGEPFPVRLGPRVIRSALQRQVQRHLQALVAGGGDERVEVVDGAQGRMYGIVAALITADRPRRPDFAGCGGDRVVAALAVHLADRVDRRQVDDVEAHPRDPGQGVGGGRERSVHRMPVGVPTAGGPREHLVPGAEPGQRPVHPHAVLITAGEHFAQGVLRQQLGDLLGQCRAGPGERIAGSP